MEIKGKNKYCELYPVFLSFECGSLILLDSSQVNLDTWHIEEYVHLQYYLSF